MDRTYEIRDGHLLVRPLFGLAFTQNIKFDKATITHNRRWFRGDVKLAIAGGGGTVCRNLLRPTAFADALKNEQKGHGKKPKKSKKKKKHKHSEAAKANENSHSKYITDEISLTFPEKMMLFAIAMTHAVSTKKPDKADEMIAKSKYYINRTKSTGSRGFRQFYTIEAFTLVGYGEVELLGSEGEQFRQMLQIQHYLLTSKAHRPYVKSHFDIEQRESFFRECLFKHLDFVKRCDFELTETICGYQRSHKSIYDFTPETIDHIIDSTREQLAIIYKATDSTVTKLTA